MDLSINHIMSHSHSIFSEKIFPSLTNRQKKILAIALLALGCLATCLYYFMRVRPEAQNIEKKLTQPNQEQEAKKTDLKIKEVPIRPGKEQAQEIPVRQQGTLKDPVPDETGRDPVSLQGKIEDPVLDETKIVLDPPKDEEPQANPFAFSLLTRTAKPVTCDPYDFGGDDTQSPGITPEHIAENARARMLMVEALGGEDACKLIPIVECPKLSKYFECFKDYAQFPKGHAIVQGEDEAGRKFVLLRLQNKFSKKIDTQIIFQRRRETCIMPHYNGQFRDQDGSGWFSPNFAQPYIKGGSFIYGAAIANMIKEIRSGTHPYFTLFFPS